MKWLQTQIDLDIKVLITRCRHSWPARHPLAAILILGLCLQWIQHAHNRWYWLDEMSLAANLAGQSPWDWVTPLRLTQLAPLGFLTVERILGTISEHRWILRLWPLTMGALALWWTWRFAQAHCSRGQERRGMIAAAILAFAPTTVYFASELKPYIGDLAAASAGWLIAQRLSQTNSLWTVRQIGPWVLLGAVLPWFSFGAIFVLAAVGMVGLIESCRAKSQVKVVFWCVIGLVWLTSFAIHYRLARELLGGSQGMWSFWEFAFLTVPPQDYDSWVAWPRSILNLFVNPLNCLVPSWFRLRCLPVVNPYSPGEFQGLPILILPSLVLFLIGAIQLWKTDKLWLTRWTLPMGLGLIATVCRLYPFHGRLVLFVMPSLVWIIAAGLHAVFERSSRLGWFVLAALALAPWLRTLQVFFEPIERFGYNALGDL